MRRLRRRTGVEFDPHWYRHTAATVLLRDGVPIEVVSKLLGHADITTTANVYGHLTVEDARQALEALRLVHRPGGTAVTVPIPLPATTRAPWAPRARRQDPGRRENSAWDIEYGRDIWRLRELGVADGTRAHISFEAIPQPWLKELAKRWARWRLVAVASISMSISGRAIGHCIRQESEIR